MSRVLLIDDDEELIALLRDYLIEEGFAVGCETDGARGVVEALSGEYAIAVLDVMMPRLSGLDAAAAHTPTE